MKVIAYTALHYGSDYLGWAIRSIVDHVDEYYVLYAAEGSHGHKTDIPCPDSRETLLNIAHDAAGAKLRWYDGSWPYEGAQRDEIHKIAPDADVILVLDADELWPTDDPIFMAHLKGFVSTGNFNRIRVPMIHFWRSFHRAVLHDPAYPERIICPFAQNATITLPTDGKVISHMGYAQRPAIVEYKQHTHGHLDQWRKDDWFHCTFMANTQVNCHPVGSEYWNPEPVNPLDYMPAFMADHPYFNDEVIE